MISDGITVTTTTFDGTFDLTATGPFVFVTRPEGWTCAHWYVPSSTENVEFVLTRDTDLFPHSFVHISDTHVGQGPYYPKPVELGGRATLTEFLTRVPDAVAGLSSVIATGDLTDRGIDVEYDDLKAAVAASPIPLHLLPGNHDHMGGAIVGAISRNNYAIHTADPVAYEKHLGPRWYSFDVPGLHVVALDWHTHELGIDHEIQNAWMAADLETIPAGMPWILLSHDQPWHSILNAAPRAPIATFSGHRHTSRVVRVDGTLHVNTPTPLFAGLDFSPPSFRVVRWDGESISLDTRSLARTGLEKATFSVGEAAPSRADNTLWRIQLPGAGHRASVRVVGNIIIAPIKDEDRPVGGVQAVCSATGETLWHTDLGSAVKSTPAVFEDIVVGVAVSGDVVAMRLEDGTELWRSPSPDPLRLFAFAEPMVHSDGSVVVGDLSHLRCLDIRTGALRWERTNLSPYQTIVDHSRPTMVGETVIVGSWPTPDSLVGLDIATGATLWPDTNDVSSVEEAFGKADTPVGTALYDVVSGDLFASIVGAVARIDTLGHTQWRIPMSLPWNPATPVSTEYGIAIIDAGSSAALIDRESGELLWDKDFDGVSPFAMSSYQRTPHVLFAEPAVLDELLLIPTLDGRIHVVDGKSGSLRGSVVVGAPVAAQPVVVGDRVYVTDVDGCLSAFSSAVFREATS
jgi:outer membrane protein assembly factor BamB